MDIWNADKLVLFIAFVVPGFVALKSYGLVEPSASRDTSQQVIDAVAYSCINYALWLWPVLLIESHEVRSLHPMAYAAFYSFIVLGSPFGLALLWHKLRFCPVIQKLLPHPTDRPWDYVFRQRKSYWMIVTLKNGQKVGGMFSGRSFASSSSSPEQLYLEQSWVINAYDGFERPKMETAGILISAAEIMTLEFVNFTYGDANERQEDTTSDREAGLATHKPATPTEGPQ